MNDSAEQLKRRRKNRNLSQAQLSVRANVPFPFISLLEHPERLERYRRQVVEALDAADREQQSLQQAA